MNLLELADLNLSVGQYYEESNYSECNDVVVVGGVAAMRSEKLQQQFGC